MNAGGRGKGIVACWVRKREYIHTGSRDQQCPHSGLVHTGVLLNSLAFRDRKRKRDRVTGGKGKGEEG